MAHPIKFKRALIGINEPPPARIKKLKTDYDPKASRRLAQPLRFVENRFVTIVELLNKKGIRVKLQRKQDPLRYLRTITLKANQIEIQITKGEIPAEKRVKLPENPIEIERQIGETTPEGKRYFELEKWQFYDAGRSAILGTEKTYPKIKVHPVPNTKTIEVENRNGRRKPISSKAKTGIWQHD